MNNDLFEIDTIRHQLTIKNKDDELKQTYNDPSKSFSELSTIEKWDGLVEFKLIPPIRLDRLKNTVQLT